MWLYVPSTSSASPAGAADSTEPSNSLLQALASSATLSGKHSPLASWRKRWKKATWLRLLCGRMPEPSTADASADAWTSSLRAFRAKATASPASDACSTMSATCGTTPFASWRSAAQGGCWSRMSEGCLFQAPKLERVSHGYLESWPSAGGMRNGSAFERPTLGPLTGDSGCSFWPTADAMVAQDGEDEASWSARRAELKAKHSNGNGCGTPLAMAVRLWTTARSADSESCGNHPEAMDSLCGVTETFSPISNNSLLPRPLAPNSGLPETDSPRPCSEAQPSNTAHQLWQTPQDPKGGGTSRSGDRMGEPLLDGQARQWPTPGSHDDKGSNEIGQRRGQLDEAAEQIFRTSPPGQPTQDGQTSSPNTPTSRRRLNPRFVAWLMGWPPIDANGCGFSEMEWSMFKARSRSVFSGIDFTGEEAK